MKNVDDNIRKKQQGFGRPIIHADFQVHKVTTVGNRVYFDKQVKTFHDFLQAYIALLQSFITVLLSCIELLFSYNAILI
jgi:hypothetical protein